MWTRREIAGSLSNQYMASRERQRPERTICTPVADAPGSPRSFTPLVRPGMESALSLRPLFFYNADST